jgi:hypothetical protein
MGASGVARTMVEMRSSGMPSAKEGNVTMAVPLAGATPRLRVAGGESMVWDLGFRA